MDTGRSANYGPAPVKTPRKKTASSSGPAARKKKPAAGRGRGTAARKSAPARKKPLKKKEPGGAIARIKPAENPKAKALSKTIAKLLLDRKAQDVAILDVRGIASYADYVVIASGESDRQVMAMAENVQQKLKTDENMTPVGFEGMETGQWVLLDYGDVVAHLFYGEVRGHYDLEGLWADAPREALS